MYCISIYKTIYKYIYKYNIKLRNAYYTLSINTIKTTNKTYYIIKCLIIYNGYLTLNDSLKAFPLKKHLRIHFLKTYLADLPTSQA